MLVLQVPVGSMQNFTYLLGDEETGEAMVIDPSWNLDKVLKLASEKGLRIRYIVNTHAHSDHSLGNRALASMTGAEVLAHGKAGTEKTRELEDGDIIKVGHLEVRVIHTPGHTPDGICLLAEKKLFTGDTLFVGECGRTDQPGGSSEDLYQSLFDRLLKLDDDVEVYPGHDYGDRPSSTIGYERRHNYTLKPRSREEFVRFMQEP